MTPGLLQGLALHRLQGDQVCLGRSGSELSRDQTGLPGAGFRCLELQSMAWSLHSSLPHPSPVPRSSFSGEGLEAWRLWAAAHGGVWGTPSCWSPTRPGWPSQGRRLILTPRKCVWEYPSGSLHGFPGCWTLSSELSSAVAMPRAGVGAGVWDFVENEGLHPTPSGDPSPAVRSELLAVCRGGALGAHLWALPT